MQHYRDYTVEDLAGDGFFQQSIRQPTAETDLFWADFLRNHPEKKAVFTTAKAFLQAVGNIQRLPASDQGPRMWGHILHQLEEADAPGQASEPPRRRIGLWWAAAAVVLLLLGFGWWQMAGPAADSRLLTGRGWSFGITSPLEERVNDTASPLTLQLADGSSVVLQPGGRLRYPASFDPAWREIHLEGEGFFEVAHNTRQPFVVYAGKVVTQVVGTSFTVRAIPGMETISVAVRTGKVAVFTLKAMEEASGNEGEMAGRLLLTPNQQAIFDTRSGRLSKRLVDEPVLVRQPDTRRYFDFEDAPVRQVFERLEQAYGVTIAYDSTAFSHCSLTAPLGNEPLFRKLDIICQTMGATYEVWGTQIVVKGPGCQAR